MLASHAISLDGRSFKPHLWSACRFRKGYLPLLSWPPQRSGLCWRLACTENVLIERLRPCAARCAAKAEGGGLGAGSNA